MKLSKIKKGIKRTLLAGAIAYPSLFAIDLITDFTSKRIETQKELEKIVHEEALNLNMNTDKIKCELKEKTTGSSAYGEKLEYHHLFVGGLLANRKIVKHELYHIYDKHCNHETKLKEELNYWLIEEPQAIIYSLTGIKL